MKLFSEYMKELSEDAKTPLKIDWIKKRNEWVGTFNIDENIFKIDIVKSNDYCDNIDVWEFEFTRNKSTKKPNDYKYPYIVVPTIQFAMGEFLKKKSQMLLVSQAIKTIKVE